MRGVVGEGRTGPPGTATGGRVLGDAGRPATLRPWVPAYPASVGVAYPAPPEPPTLHLETEGGGGEGAFCMGGEHPRPEPHTLAGTSDENPDRPGQSWSPGRETAPRLYEGSGRGGQDGPPRDGHRREGAGDAGRPATLRPWVPAYPASVGVAYPAPPEPPTLHLETEGGGGEGAFCMGGEHPRPKPHTLAGTSGENPDRPGQSWSPGRKTAPRLYEGSGRGRAGQAPTGDHHVPYPALPSLPRVAILPRPRRSVGGAAPRPVATIRPRAPEALARGGREWAVPPRTPKVETLWAVGGSPHHRPEIHQGQPRDAHAPGRRVAGSPY
ncbi:hypothetical protein GQ602_007403 [Ophiocordyceps camponoti-floridani]|uniref:Uncharacterized protein n=1 Tax=Ophiocordyceps camponoti-floridani TaxID=2030778 RepID=A0A8H4Q0A2_9HYPO|nr:hypothetical protein GQ602_007403 [Ophiocordyceps camponoti-floridani]